MSHRILLLGPPGAGKGTQAHLLSEALSIPHISTGDMFRAAIRSNSDLGQKVKSVLDSGQLVEDSLVIALVKERLTQNDCQQGFLLDGFPRTLIQAQALKDENIHLTHVIELKVDDEIIVKRLSGRRLHSASGRLYHVEFNPPKKENMDDVTGEPLIHREDDHEETIRKRLRIFHEQTEPLIGFYHELAKAENIIYSVIDGSRALEKVREEILSLLT